MAFPLQANSSTEILQQTIGVGDASNVRVSSIQSDAGLQRVSSFNQDANFLHVSGFSPDASLFRVSAHQFPDTTGGLSVFFSNNISSSGTAKSSAGSVYGWHAYNAASTNQYIKLYNTSGAINVGTDTPFMVIGLGPSARSDVSHPMGLVGFTNGISLAGVSGAPLDNTTTSPASAVGISLFYK